MPPIACMQLTLVNIERMVAGVKEVGKTQER